MKAFQPKAQNKMFDGHGNSKNKTPAPVIKKQSTPNGISKEQANTDHNKDFHINLPNENLTLHDRQQEIDLKQSSVKGSSRKRQSKIFEAPKSHQNILQKSTMVNHNEKTPTVPTKCSKAIFGVIALFIFASLTAIFMVALFANHHKSKPITFTNLYNSFLQPLNVKSSISDSSTAASVSLTQPGNNITKSTPEPLTNQEDGREQKKTTVNNIKPSTVLPSNKPIDSSITQNPKNLRVNMEDINSLKVHNLVSTAKQ